MNSNLSGHYFLNDANLKSNIKEFNIQIDNLSFKFKTDNGVFSKGELDFGTELLIKTVIKENINGSVLDFGCGYGAIGIILNKRLGVLVDMFDVNKRAVHLSKMNIIENNCCGVTAFHSDGFSKINKKYDCIVSNPPIRIGKVNLYNIIRDMKNYLNKDGKIYLVIRREQGAKTFIKDFNNLYEINVLEKKKGFYIISLKS